MESKTYQIQAKRSKGTRLVIIYCPDEAELAKLEAEVKKVVS